MKDSAMLSQLRFKNWRSLKNVEIKDLQPITVFIGANSSGKTNIIDALRFYRDSMQKGIVQVVLESGYTKIQTDALENDENVELEFTFDKPQRSSQPVTETLILQFDKRDVPFKYGRRLSEGDTLLHEDPLRELPLRDVIETFVYSISPEQAQREKRTKELTRYLRLLPARRWQILGDNFAPPLRLSQHNGGDLYVIESDAQNTLFILDFMRRVHPELYDRLQEDLRWLLHHITDVEVWRSIESRELELLIRENERKGAATISAGTARMVAMLTTFYALEMPQESPSYLAEDQIVPPSMPGLVAIEEPDTALNPAVLRNFVEQLRYYVTGEHPRQVILTTHNPTFLDYFEPEEVRVVSRDEKGYTRVNPIPSDVRNIWLDEYGLGEVWRTNSFGGLS